MTRSALLLGGTGTLAASAERLAADGWDVRVTARHPERAPAGWRERGIRVVRVERADSAAIAREIGAGVDLLVDGQCRSADDARQLAGWSRRAGSTVMLSARASYCDGHGRHINSDEPPQWGGPIAESMPLLPYADEDPFSRVGYGTSKAEAERVLEREGERVSRLRLARVHGPWARQVREWPLVRRALMSDGAVLALGVDEPACVTSVGTIAAAVVACADASGARALNVADATAPSTVLLARELLVGAGLEAGRLVLVDPADGSARSEEGAPMGLPFSGAHPLDVTALLGLGVETADPVETARATGEWLASIAERDARGRWSLPPQFEAD